MSRHNLFFAPEQETDDFRGVLQQVQEHIAGQHSELLSDGNAAEAKAHIKRYIAKFVQDSRVAVRGMTSQQLVDALFTEMAEYSFLTKYIFSEGIEEIDINSWRDIEIQYAGGRCEKLTEHFDSPEHCINVLRRMLHVSGTILDDQSPLVVGTLAENIRIAVMKSPIVDASVGAAASIRIVNPNNMEKEDFINGGTATAPMLDLLSEFIRYGISVCIAGATSSGKTTVAGWLLTTIPDNKRIFTIENGSRELSLVREKDGKVTNSVVHTLTRNSENELYRIEQIDLVDISLRFNPDIIVVGEMRGAEANAAQEVARTGVAVVTTIHSNSCESTYRRMVSLCKRAVDLSDETLMGYVTEAYPIIVFCKQLENKQRRLMEIMECEILSDNSRRYGSISNSIATVEAELIKALAKIEQVVVSKEQREAREQQRAIEQEEMEVALKDIMESEAGVKIRNSQEIIEVYEEQLFIFHSELQEYLRFRNDLEIGEYKSIENDTGILFEIRYKVNDESAIVSYSIECMDDSQGSESVVAVNIMVGENVFSKDIAYTNGEISFNSHQSCYMPETQDSISMEDLSALKEGAVDFLNEQFENLREKVDSEMFSIIKDGGSSPLAEFSCWECGEEYICIDENYGALGQCLNCGEMNDICFCDRCESYFEGTADEDGPNFCENCLEDFNKE